uniref:Uncharacterized protein n=1 Tax=Medicago truncatula TaxID=3880 RepID=I3SGY3_MEDTR|nr:unknown [Medicago truncatula]
MAGKTSIYFTNNQTLLFTCMTFHPKNKNFDNYINRLCYILNCIQG